MNTIMKALSRLSLPKTDNAVVKKPIVINCNILIIMLSVIMKIG